MALPTTGFIQPTVITTEGGVSLPTDVSKGLTVNLGTKIAGEDLANDWLNIQNQRTAFLKKDTSDLFAASTISAAGNQYGNWIDCDGYTKWTLWFKMTQDYQIYVQMRPAAETNLLLSVHAKTTTANVVTVLTNTRNVDNYNYIADEMRLYAVNTGGSTATVYAYLFFSP